MYYFWQCFNFFVIGVSRYQTLKQPCGLLPDKIPGFNFITSIGRSFRYLRVHRFRHPSSLRGVYNPLSFANLKMTNVSSVDLSDSSTTSTNSTPSSTQTISDETKINPMKEQIEPNTQSTHDRTTLQEYQYQQVFDRLLYIIRTL